MVKVIERLADFHTDDPTVMTIGNFDGVHLGHQTILERMSVIKSKHSGISTVLTFSNHPSEILQPEGMTLQVYTMTHKIKLLDELGVDVVIALPFTQELAMQSAEDFLRQLRDIIPFRHIVLGNDAVFGHHQQGTRNTIEALAKEWNFDAEYLKPVTVEDIPVSSTIIREMISRGDLDTASTLLGRKYSIIGTAILNYPTINIDVSGLCLPPYGSYAASLTCQGSNHYGVAHVGIIPTSLEVLLSDDCQKLDDRKVEITFGPHQSPQS